MKRINLFFLAMLLSICAFSSTKVLAHILGVKGDKYVVLVYVADVDDSGKIVNVWSVQTISMERGVITGDIPPLASGESIDLNEALKNTTINKAVTDYLNQCVKTELHPVRESSVYVFPNPGHGFIRVELEMTEEAPLSILLFDNSGKFIDLRNYGKFSGGNLDYKLPSDLKAGNYFLIIQSGDQSISKQISVN